MAVHTSEDLGTMWTILKGRFWSRINLTACSHQPLPPPRGPGCGREEWEVLQKWDTEPEGKGRQWEEVAGGDTGWRKRGVWETGIEG